MNIRIGPKGSYKRTVGRTAAFNVGMSAASIVTGILIARWLGPEARGDYAAVSVYFLFSLVIFELGLGASVVYHVAKAGSSYADYVRTAMWLLLPLAFLAGATAILVGIPVFGDTDGRRAAFLVLPVSILISFGAVGPSFALQSVDIAKWNLVRMSQPLVFFLLTVGVGLCVPLTTFLVINLMNVSLLVQALISWWLYTRLTPARGHIDKRYIGPLLRFGILNMFSTTPNALNSRVDQLVLAVTVTSAALGQYAVAVSLSMLASPLVSAFGNVAFPRIARGDSVLETIRTAVRGSLVVSVVVCGTVAIAGPWLVGHLLGDGYEQVTVLLLVLTPGAAVVAVNRVFGDILRGLGRPGFVAVCECVGVVLTVGGLMWLVPYFGILGAAITSSAVYMVVFLVLKQAISHQVGRVKHPVPFDEPSD